MNTRFIVTDKAWLGEGWILHSKLDSRESKEIVKFF